MDFDLNEEQRLLKESADRLFADRYTFERRREYMTTPDGWSRDVWKRCAELGFLGILVPAEHGGFGGTAVETMILMEAMGKSLALEPFLPTAVMAATAIATAGSTAQRANLLPKIANGETVVSLAHGEPAARYDLQHVEATASGDAGQWVLNGHKNLALYGAEADWLIVSGRVYGSVSDSQGIQLFVIDARAPGISRQGHTLHDGTRAADIRLDNVKVADSDRLGTAATGHEILERIVMSAVAALAAETVGAMDAALDITVKYLKTRRQFGTEIGKFQVLQHKAADMLIALEQARSMAMYAASMVDHADADERRRGCSAVKAFIGQAGRFVGHQGVQLHGGIGVTDEYPISHYLKRLAAIGVLFGDADHHIASLARQGGLYRAG